MRLFIPSLIRQILSYRVIRFGITGGLAFLLEFGTFFILLHHASPEQNDLWKNIWHIVSMELSILFTFHMHNFFTWAHEHEKGYLKKIVQFHAVTGFTILLRLIGFYFMNAADIHWTLSKLLPLIVAILINFITYNFFVFKKREAA